MYLAIASMPGRMSMAPSMMPCPSRVRSRTRPVACGCFLRLRGSEVADSTLSSKRPRPRKIQPLLDLERREPRNFDAFPAATRLCFLFPRASVETTMRMSTEKMLSLIGQQQDDDTLADGSGGRAPRSVFRPPTSPAARRAPRHDLCLGARPIRTKNQPSLRSGRPAEGHAGLADERPRRGAARWTFARPCRGPGRRAVKIRALHAETVAQSPPWSLRFPAFCKTSDPSRRIFLPPLHRTEHFAGGTPWTFAPLLPFRPASRWKS